MGIGGTILAIFAWCCFASIPAGVLLLVFRRFKPVDDPLSDHREGDCFPHPVTSGDFKLNHVRRNER